MFSIKPHDLPKSRTSQPPLRWHWWNTTHNQCNLPNSHHILYLSQEMRHDRMSYLLRLRILMLFFIPLNNFIKSQKGMVQSRGWLVDKKRCWVFGIHKTLIKRCAKIQVMANALYWINICDTKVNFVQMVMWWCNQRQGQDKASNNTMTTIKEWYIIRDHVCDKGHSPKCHISW